MSTRIKISIGNRFNKWTVKSPSSKNILGWEMWKCVCDCGVVKNVSRNSLLMSQSKSCGCSRKIKRGKRTSYELNTPEYKCWAAMKNRCNSKKCVAYKHYGGRGIKVCDRWLNSFENFLEDMGDRPTKKHSIERRDNDGNYEPSNCYWGTKKEQCRNRRNSRIIKFNNILYNLTDLGKLLNIRPELISYHLKKNKSIDYIIDYYNSKRTN